jgi:thiol:disulfide interchange protein DsbD
MPKPRLAESLRRSVVVARTSVAAASALVGLTILFWHVGALAAELKLLPPEQAFRFAGRALDTRTLEANFSIADGYYLYRDKMSFALEPDSLGLGATSLPPGKVKDDEFFGRVETYRDRVVIRLPMAKAAPGQSVTLRADSQGCADAGVCYPPQTQRITLAVPATDGKPGPLVEAEPAKKNWFQ